MILRQISRLAAVGKFGDTINRVVLKKKGRGMQQFSLICLFKISRKNVLRDLSISLIFITKKNTQE